MNDRRQDPRRKRVPAWHRVFLAMLPKIVAYARGAFSGLDPEARQEAVQNVVANSCAAVAALARRGKLDLCYPTVLARFGIRQTRDNRITGGKLNVRDVMSKYCQAKKGVVVERLDHFDDEENASMRRGSHGWSGGNHPHQDRLQRLAGIAQSPRSQDCGEPGGGQPHIRCVQAVQGLGRQDQPASEGACRQLASFRW